MKNEKVKVEKISETYSKITFLRVRCQEKNKIGTLR